MFLTSSENGMKLNIAVKNRVILISRGLPGKKDTFLLKFGWPNKLLDVIVLFTRNQNMFLNPPKTLSVMCCARARFSNLAG